MISYQRNCFFHNQWDDMLWLAYNKSLLGWVYVCESTIATSITLLQPYQVLRKIMFQALFFIITLLLPTEPLILHILFEMYCMCIQLTNLTKLAKLNSTRHFELVFCGLGWVLNFLLILFLFCFVLLLNFFFEAWVGFKLTQFSSLVNQPNPHAINNLRNVCILNLLDWFILDFEDLFKFVSLIYFGILRFNFDKVGSIEY